MIDYSHTFDEFAGLSSSLIMVQCIAVCVALALCTNDTLEACVKLHTLCPSMDADEVTYPGLVSLVRVLYESGP